MSMTPCGAVEAVEAVESECIARSRLEDFSFLTDSSLVKTRERSRQHV